MRGGYIYNSTVKKKSFRKSRLSNISKNKTSKKNITAGRKNKYRKMRKNHKKTHAKKNKKHRKKLSRRKQRGGQALGNSPFSDSYTNTIPSRLPAGVYLNTVQGYSADLSNPPLSGVNTVSQCTNN